MMNIAVLIQLIGLVLTFTIGTAGYLVGPALIVIGALIYRKENQRRKLEAGALQQGIPGSPPPAHRWWTIPVAALCIVPACLALIFVMTAGIVDAADGFFKAVANHDLPKAKTYLSVEFAAASTPDELKGFLDRSALSRFEAGVLSGQPHEISL